MPHDEGFIGGTLGWEAVEDDGEVPGLEDWVDGVLKITFQKGGR